ncbi:MAG: DUF2232 domain-containing protein [Rhodospirillaceae bacterium]
MAKPMLIAVAAGLLCLIGVLAFFNGLPGGILLVFIASLPIYLAGFAYGAVAGTVASLSSFVAAGLTGGVFLAGFLGFLYLIPAWTITRQAMTARTAPDGTKHWTRPETILTSVTVIAGGILLLIGVLTLAKGPGLSAVVAQQIDSSVNLIGKHVVDGERFADALKIYGDILFGLGGSLWIVLAVLTAMLAQTILTKMKLNMRPMPNFDLMLLPDWLSWAMVASALIALLVSGEIGFLARNLALIMAAPFLFMGLSVIHKWSREKSHRFFLLSVLYFLLMTTYPIIHMVVSAIGIYEQWAGGRSRLVAHASGN